MKTEDYCSCGLEVARTERFGIKEVAISFVCSDKDLGVLMKMQERLEVKIDVMPARTDTIAYLNRRVG